MIILVFFFLNSLAAQAQDSSTQRLFSSNAVAKANQKLKENHKRKFTNFTFNEGASSESLSQALSLDSVSDIVQDNIGGADYFVQSNSPFYLHYVNDLVHINELDEFLSSSAAEKAFIYQSLSATINFLKTSALEPFYRETMKNLQVFRDYTTVKFNQDGKGNLGVVSPEKKDEESLFELKLYVSANTGVEPRLEIGKHLLFRYDVFRQNALMEVRSNF